MPASRTFDPALGVALGRVIVDLRTARRWTQAQLAARAGLTDTCVRGVERAMTMPHRATVAAIAAELGLSVDELLAAAEARRESEAAS